MKVRQECVRDPKLVARRNRQLGFPSARLNFPISIHSRLKRARGSGAYRDDSSALGPGLIDYRSSFIVNLEKFRSDVVLRNIVDSHRLESAVADVQCDFNNASLARSQSFADFGREMKSGGGRRNSSLFTREDRLVAFPVLNRCS